MMHRWQCAVAWILGLICLALSVATIWLASGNQRMEQSVLGQRTLIERGILGQQGQQVGNNILQDLAATAQRNVDVRDLLARHGFKVASDVTNAPASSLVAATNVTAMATGGAQ